MLHYTEDHLPKTWIKHLKSKHAFPEKGISSTVRSVSDEILGTFVL